VFAQAIGIAAGASLLYMLFVTWGPLARAAGRPAEGVLLVSAFVGAVIATAVSVVISATQKTEAVEEATHVSLAGRRVSVR
jgi:ABC-type Fe3+-siderophore transport system permease subunit